MRGCFSLDECVVFGLFHHGDQLHIVSVMINPLLLDELLRNPLRLRVLIQRNADRLLLRLQGYVDEHKGLRGRGGLTVRGLARRGVAVMTVRLVFLIYLLHRFILHLLRSSTLSTELPSSNRGYLLHGMFRFSLFRRHFGTCLDNIIRADHLQRFPSAQLLQGGGCSKRWLRFVRGELCVLSTLWSKVIASRSTKCHAWIRRLLLRLINRLSSG